MEDSLLVLVCLFLLFCCFKDVFLTSFTRLSLEALAAARLSSQASATVIIAVSEALRRTEEFPELAVLVMHTFVVSSMSGTVEKKVSYFFICKILNFFSFILIF